MSFRIGGDFEILPHMFLQAPNKNAFKVRQKHHIYLDSGRSSLLIALLKIIELGGAKEAWLPGFACRSVVQPFEQLGFRVNFYSMGDDLQKPKMLPTNLRGSTFLFINYFGKRNDSIINWLKEKKNHSCDFFVIEDCVQAALSEDVGNIGDFVVYSFRKYFPQPDGALLTSNFPLEFKLTPPDEAYVSEKLIGKLIRGQNGDPEEFLAFLNSAEQRLDKFIRPRFTSRLSNFLFERTDFADIACKRRKNWFYLMDSLQEVFSRGIVSPLFADIGKGEVPLGLPVVVHEGKRDVLRSFLFEKNIFCPVHWPIDIEDIRWTSEMNLSSSIMTIPLDQRLSEPELQYLADSISMA